MSEPITPNQTDARRRALLAKMTDAALLAEARKLYARTDTTPAENMTAAWLADELHRRHPDTEAIMDRYLEDDERMARNYGELLADALREAGAL